VPSSAPIFAITKIERGVADVVVRSGEQECACSISSHSDGLSMFIAAVAHVAWGMLVGAECRWEHDPFVSSVWLRARDDRRAELRLELDRTEWGAPDVPKFEETFRAVVGLRDLARDVGAAFARVHASYGAAGYEARWSYSFPQERLDALAAWHAGVEEEIASSALGAAVITELLCRDVRGSVAIAEALGAPHAQVVVKLRSLAAHRSFELVERPDDGAGTVEVVAASFSPALQRYREWLCRGA
jgi:hypothetical protein